VRFSFRFFISRVTSVFRVQALFEAEHFFVYNLLHFYFDIDIYFWFTACLWPVDAPFVVFYFHSRFVSASVIGRIYLCLLRFVGNLLAAMPEEQGGLDFIFLTEKMISSQLDCTTRFNASLPGTLDRGRQTDGLWFVSSKRKLPVSDGIHGCNAIPSHPHAHLCHLQPHRAHRYFPAQIALFSTTFAIKARKTSISVAKLKLAHSVPPNRLRNELQIDRKTPYLVGKYRGE